MHNSHNEFWNYLETLIAQSEIVIDRPRDSAHPVYADTIYPLDYGYLAGTVAADGGGIDIWLGTLDDKQVTGIVSSIDLLKKDAEVKILYGCTEDEMQIILAFLNQGDQRGILIKRES